MKQLTFFLLTVVLTSLLLISCKDSSNPVTGNNSGCVKKVELSWPNQEDTLQAGTHTFYCHQGTCDSVYHYRLQISYTDNFPTGMLLNTVNYDTVFTNLNLGQTGVTFYWRVIAKYESDSVISAVRKFWIK